jgi:hypothetical protein
MDPPAQDAPTTRKGEKPETGEAGFPRRSGQEPGTDGKNNLLM